MRGSQWKKYRQWPREGGREREKARHRQKQIEREINGDTEEREYKNIELVEFACD